jgi:hypothetical protein
MQAFSSNPFTSAPDAAKGKEKFSITLSHFSLSPHLEQQQQPHIDNVFFS